MRHTNPGLSIGLTFLNNKNQGWSLYGGEVMENIESNGEVSMNFNLTLAYVAEFDTIFVKLDYETMALMSIFGCTTTN